MDIHFQDWHVWLTVINLLLAHCLHNMEVKE